MKNEKHTPPKVAAWLLERFLPRGEKPFLLEDFGEIFRETAEENGRTAACLWYWQQILMSVPRFIVNSVYWRIVMFRNYIKTTLRNVRKHKGYSLINITGLAAGMACSILLMIYVQSELSFDRFHENKDNIYRMGMHAVADGAEFTWYSSNAVAAGVLKRDYPEVVDAVRMGWAGFPTVQYKDNNFYERNIMYADASVFNIFTFPLIRGNPATALREPYTVVITEEMAEKYFGSENPLGKVIIFNNRENYTVTGVMQNVPDNSDFFISMLCSFETLYAKHGRDYPILNAWISFNYITYLLLQDGFDYKELEAKFPALIEKHAGKQLRASGSTMEFLLQPLTDMHLRTPVSGNDSGGAILYVYIFTAIAIFILLMACINFMNLSTARSANRAVEVGIRKVVGAEKKRLVGQFLGESIIYSFLSLSIAVIIVIAALPHISGMAGRELSLTLEGMEWLLPFLLGLVLVTGLAAGSYPALFLASFKPVTALKSGLKSGASGSRFRSILVVIQFSISIALIIGTGLIINQLGYMRDKNPGFNKEHVVILRIRDDNILRSIQEIRGELQNNPNILAAGLSSTLPGWGAQFNNFLPEGYSADQIQLMDDVQADPGFIPAMGMEIAEGRNFSEDFSTDRKSVIINETAARIFNWKEPIGKIIRRNGVAFTVIGVVKNVHIRPVDEEIEPMCIGNNPDNRFNRANLMSVRMRPGDIAGSFDYIESVWKKFTPGTPFDYFFLNESFDEQFAEVERTQNIFSNFTVIAIMIACLGLFGIASFTAEQRTKEIGIRKTFGASVPGIIMMLNKETFRLILIANVIAWPAAYFLTERWFRVFPYRADIGVQTFALSAAAVFAVGFITVAYQSFRAARANPAESLKYE